MNRSKVPLLAAVVIVALYIVGSAMLAPPLAFDSSPADTVAWLKSHHGDVPVAVTCFTLTVIPFLILVAWTRRALPEIYGYAFLAAAGAFVAQFLVSTWFLAGAAVHAETIDPHTARSLLDVGAYFGPVLTTTDVVMAGAVALAALRDGVLPRELGWLSGVFALEQLVEIATAFGRTGFAAPGGAWNNVVGAGLFMLWALALGFAVGRRPEVKTAGGQVQASA
jgi:hypothetical protein